MTLSTTDKAGVLIQALPYIQKYTDKIVVIKYGGNAMIDDALKQAVMSDLVLLSLVGIKVVLVHGGGPEISQTLQRMGKESKFIGGLRVTDAETAEIVQMVLCGKVNKDLVSSSSKTTAGRSACAASTAKCSGYKKLAGEVDLGYVGDITSVDTTPSSTPCTTAISPSSQRWAPMKRGQVYNINADTAAARIASELGAENIILMTDIRGLLEKKEDESTPHSLRAGQRRALSQKTGRHFRG